MSNLDTQLAKCTKQSFNKCTELRVLNALPVLSATQRAVQHASMGKMKHIPEIKFKEQHINKYKSIVYKMSA